MKNLIIKNAFMNAVMTIGYIVIVSLFLFYVPKSFDSAGDNVILIPILMLSLLVFSVAIVGVSIFGRPIIWYLDGKRTEAVHLLAYTLGIFFVIAVLLFLTLFFIL